jgi:lipopolysaccharide export system protein LptA
MIRPVSLASARRWPAVVMSARGRVALLALLALLAAMPGAAQAQGIDLTQGGPIQVTAHDGLDWRQNDQVVIARGDARAVRGGVTVTADRLLAWYRPKSAAPADGASRPAAGLATSNDTGGNEVYRLRAEGNVHIYTETDQAWGDQATYDLDQAVLVMTGQALKLTTPNDTLTARDTLEYWSQKHMAVARGDAIVVTNDARRIQADTLVAYTIDQQTPSEPRPATGKDAAKGDQTAAMAGKLDHVEAFDNVSIRTLTDIVTGDRGIYVPDTGIARLGGHVRITRGDNQIDGAEAIVNMKTGVATLQAGDQGRVTGLVVPADKTNTDGTDRKPSGGASGAKAPEGTPR